MVRYYKFCQPTGCVSYLAEYSLDGIFNYSKSSSGKVRFQPSACGLTLSSPTCSLSFFVCHPITVLPGLTCQSFWSLLYILNTVGTLISWFVFLLILPHSIHLSSHRFHSLPFGNFLFKGQAFLTL